MKFAGWKEKLFQRYLVWNCRPARIRRYFRSVLPGSVPVKTAETVDRRKIRAAAVQVKLTLHKSPLQFADDMHRRVREAVNEGAILVAFPEYNNLPLLGLLPGIEQMEESYRQKAINPGLTGTEQDKQQEDIKLTDVFHYMSPAVKPLVDAVFSSLAEAYKLYIMAGSYTLADNGSVVNRSFLYGPSGKMLGSQDKVHLLPVEEKWQLKRGSTFNTYDTSLGRLALPVCMDATYFETFRILEQSKTDIVLLPIANQEEYNYWLALRGIWPRVQESRLYGVKSALVGSIAGLTFTGRSGIYAPLELTPTKDGVLAEVETYKREAMAVADLDLEALHELRRNDPWRDKNPVLYRRYFPEIYNNRVIT
ncbi:MAG: nitrilase-related carbon-nitrogen hydrolase [Bacillota bacterium]